MISDESVVLWYGFEIIFIDCNGVIRKTENKSPWKRDCKEHLKTVVERNGCLYRDNGIMEISTLRKYIDKPFSEYEAHLKKRAVLYQKRKQRPTQRKELDAHREKFGDMIVGVDKKEIDIFPTGFRVSLLFNTGKQYSEQIEYLKNHFKLCSDYVLEQVSQSRNKTAKTILPVCKLQEVVMTKRNEAVFVFEIADRVRIAFET